MPNAKVETIHVGMMQMNCYLVENPETQELFIVDPGAEGGKIIRAIGDRTPVAVLLTHGHFDHIGAADTLCSHYHIPLYVHEADAPKLRDPEKNVSAVFGELVTAETLPTLLHDDQELTLCGLPVKVLRTPGHSVGSCCFLVGDDGCVFCGDTLFDGGYGRTDFEDGDFEALRESLRALYHLTPRRVAYPGHGNRAWAGRDRAETP